MGSSEQDVGGDLSEYYVPPSTMKKVLRKYRRLSEPVSADMTLAELDRKEDESKAFALFKMRSRIMEKDMERDLERRGGTVPVDDLITNHGGVPPNGHAHSWRGHCERGLER